MVTKLARLLPFDLSSHKLRQNFATNYCLDQYEKYENIGIQKLVYLMGHEDARTASRCLHFAYEMIAVKENISHVDSVFSGKSNFFERGIWKYLCRWKKAPVRGISPKLVLYMRDQGLEPWIPWLRGDRIVMIIRLTKGDIGNTIVMLSRPIWQQKVGVEFWIFWFLLFFPLWQV